MKMGAHEEWCWIYVDWGADFDHFHCPVAVRERLRKVAEERGTTVAQVLIDAKFGNTWDALMSQVWPEPV